jgi:hypothetical protein
MESRLRAHTVVPILFFAYAANVVRIGLKFETDGVRSIGNLLQEC